MGRQGRPGWRMGRGHPTPGTHPVEEEGQDKDAVWVAVVVGVQKMGVPVTEDGREQLLLGLLRHQDARRRLSGWGP